MKKTLRLSLLGILAIGIFIQLIPYSLPENNEDLSNDLIATQNVPSEISNILMQSCYDCHSTQTVYPWYSYVAPVSWLVARDVNKGREELNLSAWNTLSKRKQLKSLNNIAEEVESREMPMKIYTLVHRNSILDENEINLIVNWANTKAEQMLNTNDKSNASEEESGEEESENEDATVQ